MDEKIEEMAKLIKPIVVSSYLVDRGNDEVKQKTIEEVKNQQRRNATALYNAGYRKEIDTAKEICDLILEHWEKKQFVECDWLRVAIAEKYGVDLGE